MTATGAPTIDVGRVMDDGAWGAYQKWLVFLTALVIVFDGFDNQLLGVALPSMMREWGVPRSAFSPIVSLGYLGMMIGGTLAGIAGDRIGRRTALLGCMVLFAVATLATAGAGSLAALAALRLVAGVGLGGAMPNAAALAAEYVPRAQRPFAVTLAIVCIPVGATMAGIAGATVLPAIGWRALFAAGGLAPLVVAVALFRILPESPRYLARHPDRWPELARLLRRMDHQVPSGAVFEDASEPAARTSLRAIAAPGLRGDTLALWVAFSSCLLAVYLGLSWLPAIFAANGLGTAAASHALTAFSLGGVVGALIGGRLLTHLGSRQTMVGMTLAAIVCSLVMSRLEIAGPGGLLPVLIVLTLTGGLINAVQTTMYALAAHVYPAAIRAAGVGTAVALGRSGAILTGYAGPWALEYRGSESFFWLMAASLGVTAMALAAVTRHVPRAR